MSSISRREFLRVSTVVVAGGVLTACGATPTPTSLPPAVVDTVAPPVPTDTVPPSMPTSTPAPVLPTATAAAKPTGTPRPFPLGNSVPRERTLNYAYGIVNGIANPMCVGYNHQDGYALLYEPGAYYAAHADKTYMWLVESYDVATDGKQFTLHFRKGITWSDGTAFTTADPMWAMGKLKSVTPTLPRGSDFAAEVDSLTAVDDNTLVIKLNQPDFRFFIKNLTFRFDNGTDTCILPQHLFKDVADKDLVSFKFFDTAKGWPVTTSPYGMAESTDQATKFDIRPSWWAVKTGLVAKEPDVWRVISTTYQNDTLGVQQIINNELDVTLDIRPMIMTSLLTQTDHVTTWSGRKPPFGYLDWWPISVYFANNRAPFNDPKFGKNIRWAVAHAINHQQVVDVGWVGAGKATSYPYPEFKHLLTFLDSIKDIVTANDPQEFSLDKSAKLMTEAGYAKNKDGFWAKPGQPAENFDLYGPVPLFADLAPIVAEQLRTAGFNCQHKSPQDVWNAISDGRASLCLFGHGGSVFDPFDTLMLYRKKDIQPVGKTQGNNMSRWSNADFEKIVDTMNNTPMTDDATMKDLFHKAMTIWYSELPDCPLVQWMHRIPLNTTYWTNWPSADNPYMNAAPWHLTALQVVMNLKAVKAS
ncbi:MAG TPA: ABC transporter substrate-binding protein [Anaerolineaceae bacterium]